MYIFNWEVMRGEPKKYQISSNLDFNNFLQTLIKKIPYSNLENSLFQFFNDL